MIPILISRLSSQFCRSKQHAGRSLLILPVIASGRHHPQPAMHCSWCQFKNECKAWLPGMTVADIHRQEAA